MNNAESHKKQALLIYKQKILNDLKYFDERLKEAQNKPKQIDEDCYSSDDSDIDLTKSIDLRLSFPSLKRDQTKLKTCLHATQELTSVEVLESEINLLVEDPVIDGAAVLESGNWYEVVAECRLDLVQFLITFLVHRSSRKFGPVHYRNLQVTPVKKAHENELTSALAALSKPADAIEIINQYAEEHRSRRNTLARLADTFAGALRMAPMPEGGYTLQCLDLLEIRWLVKYSKSRVRFQHALKFDIDHLDENYIMVIKTAYQQLNNTTTTEKRTLLLEKIIRTCIEASGRTDFGESTDQSDQEVVDKLVQKHPQIGIDKKDSEIMAPPKSLPKKTKSKGKENKDRNAIANSNNELPAVPAKKTKKDTTVDVKLKSVDVVKTKDVQKKSIEEQKINNEILEVPAKKTKKDTTADVIVKSLDKSKDVVPKKSNVEQKINNEIPEVPAKKTKKDTMGDPNLNSLETKTKHVSKKSNVEQKNVTSANKEVAKKSVPETQSGDKQSVPGKTKKNISPVYKTSNLNKDNVKVIDQSKKLKVKEKVSKIVGMLEKSKKKISPVNAKSNNKKEIVKSVDQNTKSVPGSISNETQKPATNKKIVSAVIDKPNTHGAEKNTKSKEVETTNKQKLNVNVKASGDDTNKKARKTNKEIRSIDKTEKNVAKTVSKIPKFKPSK